MKTSILGFLALVACSKGGDDCERLVDKMLPALKEDGASAKQLDRDKLVGECRQHLDKLKTEPMKCVLDAKDDEAVRACVKDGMAAYKSRAKKTEANLQLNRLEKLLKMSYVERAEFPKGQAKTLPEKGCCGGPGGKCEVADWASDPVWKSLDFRIDEATLFQYSYASDGQTVHATAVGDLDCDTTMITYVLDGKIDGGKPTFTLTEPPPNAD